MLWFLFSFEGRINRAKFWLSLPSNGTYRMFFDFQVAGQVHTTAWTVIV